MFRACIHRGAHEIGGSCVELACDGQRLVLDVGLPLDAGLNDEVPLPAIAGLAERDPSLLGLIITHGHPDHYGLVTRAQAELPVYVGEATSRILAEAIFFTPMGATLRPSGFLVDRQPLEIGPFRVTPFLVDHSAFDAYAVLVEAGGRRLLYSGDLRAHGRKASLFERLLAEPPTVDSLLLEGTRVLDDGRRAGAADPGRARAHQPGDDRPLCAAHRAGRAHRGDEGAGLELVAAMLTVGRDADAPASSRLVQPPYKKTRVKTHVRESSAPTVAIWPASVSCAAPVVSR